MLHCRILPSWNEAENAALDDQHVEKEKRHAVTRSYSVGGRGRVASWWRILHYPHHALMMAAEAANTQSASAAAGSAFQSAGPVVFTGWADDRTPQA
jgi:hypothetical protein